MLFYFMYFHDNPSSGLYTVFVFKDNILSIFVDITMAHSVPYLNPDVSLWFKPLAHVASVLFTVWSQLLFAMKDSKCSQMLATEQSTR